MSLPLYCLQRTWCLTGLLLICLLMVGGCATRNRPDPTLTSTAIAIPYPTFTPTATTTATPTRRPTYTLTPTIPPTATPTATATATPTLTPAAHAEGVYANLEVHQGGSYRLRRRGDLVEADLASRRSAVQHAARQQPQVLFTLPPEFRPPFPVLRRVAGQPVLVDGSLDPTQPDPRPFRLQLEPDGRVRYLEHPDVEGVGYLAYSLHLAWGTTPAANDQAVLQILAEIAQEDISRFDQLEFEDGRITRLEQNDLTGEIPPELGQLSHLQVLRLQVAWGEHLTALPPELGQLQNLTHLNLSNNGLTVLPPELGQLQNLTYLNLSRNPVTELPPEVGQLAHLQIVHLSQSKLSVLPPELGQLQNLKLLNLSANKLIALPPELGQLANLTTLYLRGNQLTALPPELGQLGNLRKLHLDSNQLAELPPELDQLANLESLNLSGNPWTGCLPVAWRDQGINFTFSKHPPFCNE